MRFSALKSRSSRPTGRVIGGILALALVIMLGALATAQPISAVPSIHLAGGVTSIPYQDPIDRPRPEFQAEENWGSSTISTILYVLIYLVLNALLTWIVFREGYKRGEKSVTQVKWDDVEKAINASFDARFKEAEPYLPEKVFEETQKVIRRARDTVSADVKKVFEKK